MSRGALEAALARHRGGDLAGAEVAYRELLAQRPGDPVLLRHLALALQQQGRAAEALDLYREALARAPGDAGLLLLTGFALRDLGRAHEARPLAARADLLLRGDPAAKLLLGSVLVQLGEFAAAESALRAALARDPGLLDAELQLAIALHRQRRWSEAVQGYQRVQRARPEDPDLLHNLGLCAEGLGDPEAALGHFAAAVAAAPQRADLLGRLANAQALLCDWSGLEASTAALQVLLEQPDAGREDQVVEPFVLLFLALDADARTEALARHARRLQRRAAVLPPVRHGRSGAGSRIRLGYLSPDFGQHAVGGLVRALFAGHDRRRFEVHGFDLGGQDDQIAREIAAGCDHWHALAGAPAGEVAAAIADSGIDVLVDLGGFTLGALPEVLALRPAPLQLGWLGFLHDYGEGLVDYLVLDRELAPPEDPARYGPALLRLPGSALPASPTPSLAPEPRCAFGLPPGRVLLASFNNSYKLDRELFEAWQRILEGAPATDLVLWLPPPAHPRFVRAWLDAGLSRQRLHLVDKLPPARHRARMAACDLFLDAFRYQAGATAIDAALAGLPLLSRRGDRPSARLGASLNRLLGLDALVVDDTDIYVARALELAADPAQLAAIRGQLAGAVADHGLADPARTLAALEPAIALAWARHGDRQPALDLDLCDPGVFAGGAGQPAGC